MKVIFTGLESSGKSLKLAMTANEIAHRNAKWKKISGKERPLASNMQFSREFEDYVMEELGLPIIYWSNVDELIKLESADVFIDEVANYFDARLWADLSLDARRWLTQGAKTGIEIYGSAQDFAQVDKSFRRLVNHLFYIRKIAGSRRPSPTKPPVEKIWGLCMVNELDPQTYNEDKSKFANRGALDFSFFFIERTYCNIFNTNQKIVRSLPSTMRHIERACEDEKCGYHKTIHV